MSNAITIYEQMSGLQTAATALYQSGFFKDVASQAQAMVKVMAGAELGLPPFASMSGIHLVQGKPILGANLIATLIKNDPRYNYRVKQADNQTCILSWYEHGELVGESGFTMAEAAAASLSTKDNWKKYPSDMLFARAISRGARRFAPGIFGGAPVYTPDEFDLDTDEDGHIVQGEIVSVTPPQVQPPTNGKTEAQPEPEIARVYGNGHKLPASMTKSIAGFDAYTEAHGHAPQDHETLKAWAASLSDTNGNGNSTPAAPVDAQPAQADWLDASEKATAGAFTE